MEGKAHAKKATTKSERQSDGNTHLTSTARTNQSGRRSSEVKRSDVRRANRGTSQSRQADPLDSSTNSKDTIDFSLTPKTVTVLLIVSLVVMFTLGLFIGRAI